MERVIDRKEYRRNSEKEEVLSEEQIDILHKKIKKVLLQSLGASSILLIVSFLKFFNCSDILNKVNNNLNSEITISSLQKSGQRIFAEVNKYYTNLNVLIEGVFSDSNSLIKMNNAQSGEVLIQDKIDDKDKINNDLVINNIINFKSGEILENSIQKNTGENVRYEMAVEGINQMSEDANNINENYDLVVPVIGTITSEFGVRNSNNPKVSNYHSGLDIAANTGTQIIAAIDGEVIEATTDTYYGKYLKIKKDDIVMIYAHCSKLLVKKGDSITKGQLIAYVGNTGNSTGPHLHFEVKYNDRLVDPKDILEI